MSEVLGLSTRRLPDAADVVLRSASAIQPPSDSDDSQSAALVDALFRDELSRWMSWQGDSARAAVAALAKDVYFSRLRRRFCYAPIQKSHRRGFNSAGLCAIFHKLWGDRF